jgi:hypothetical protein
VVMLCVVCVALAAPAPRDHVTAPGSHPPAPTAAAAAASSGGDSR